MGRQRQASIGFKLSLTVAAVTCGVMVAIVASISYYEYTEQIEHVAHDSRRIGQHIVPQLASAIRGGDEDAVRHVLAGLLDLRHLACAELVVAGDTVRAGMPPAVQVAPKSFPVDAPDGARIGELHVQFDRASVRREFWHHARIETSYVLLLVMVMAVATVLVFRRLVTRHLDALAEYARSLAVDTLDRGFDFDRRPGARADELDRLHAAIETMRGNLTREIEGRREAEQLMHQMQRLEAVGRLASGIAHDFNNLLAGIMGTAETIVREARQPEIRGYGEMIVGTARRAGDLTGRLLTFSRQAPVVVKPQDLHAIITDVCAILERSIDKNITLVTELGAEHPRVNADRALLQSAILNLGLNARDAMPDGGVLTIRTALVHAAGAAADQVEVAVVDTGGGVSPELREEVFKPFFTTKEQGKGTGLGLSSAAATIRDHGGTISFDSREGVGTIFRLRLPLAAGDDVAAPSATDMVLPGTGVVLVIDDDNSVRNSLCRSLTELGYRVLCAEDGAAGLDLYRRHAAKIDVIILDMIMPKLSGPRTFAAIREFDPQARVIVTTGFAEDGAMAELLAAGAEGPLRKPFLYAELSQVVARTLSR